MWLILRDFNGRVPNERQPIGVCPRPPVPAQTYMRGFIWIDCIGYSFLWFNQRAAEMNTSLPKRILRLLKVVKR